MRVLVTGSRKGVPREKVYEVLDQIYNNWVHDPYANDSPGERFVVVHGAARGVDRMAADWAVGHFMWGEHVDQEAHPATWTDGKKAGPIRNQKMVDLGADLCIAFPIEGSIGTWDCVRKARKAGIETMVIRDLVIKSKEEDK